MKRFLVRDEEYDMTIREFDFKEEAIKFAKEYSKENEIVVTVVDTMFKKTLIFKEFPIWF